MEVIISSTNMCCRNGEDSLWKTILIPAEKARDELPSTRTHFTFGSVSHSSRKLLYLKSISAVDRTNLFWIPIGASNLELWMNIVNYIFDAFWTRWNGICIFAKLRVVKNHAEGFIMDLASKKQIIPRVNQIQLTKPITSLKNWDNWY